MHACNTKVGVPLVIAIHISSCSAMHRAIFHSKLVMYQFISLYAYVLVNRSTWFHLALISPSESTSLHHTSLVPWTLDWSHYFLHWYLTLYIPSNTLCTLVFWLEHLHCRVSQKIFCLVDKTKHSYDLKSAFHKHSHSTATNLWVLVFQSKRNHLCAKGCFLAISC